MYIYIYHIYIYDIIYIYICTTHIYIYIYTHIERERETSEIQESLQRCCGCVPQRRDENPQCLRRLPMLHPVSITRFPLTRFSPGAGLLRNPFVTLSTLRFSRGWVRKDGNLLMETGCITTVTTVTD